MRDARLVLDPNILLIRLIKRHGPNACTNERGWRERRYDHLTYAGVVPGHQ
jgi:hypothetical protein